MFYFKIFSSFSCVLVSLTCLAETSSSTIDVSSSTTVTTPAPNTTTTTTLVFETSLVDGQLSNSSATSEITPTTITATISNDLNNSLILNQSNCGIRQIIRQGKIINGTNAVHGDYPWIISLRYNNRHHCGGTLINGNWVLTAAHCVYKLTADRFNVKLGGHLRNNPVEPTSITVAPILIVPHSGFNYATFNDDLALIKLPFMINFNKYIQPICLPEINEENLFMKKAMVIGWGRINHVGLSSNTLQEVELPIVNNVDCKAWYREKNKWLSIKPTQLCAGFEEGGKDACQGDSGSPMLITNPNTQRSTIVGIVSAGIGCALPKLPGLYTRVTSYLQWIQKTMEQYENVTYVEVTSSTSIETNTTSESSLLSNETTSATTTQSLTSIPMINSTEEAQTETSTSINESTILTTITEASIVTNDEAIYSTTSSLTSTNTEENFSTTNNDILTDSTFSASSETSTSSSPTITDIMTNSTPSDIVTVVTSSSPAIIDNQTNSTANVTEMITSSLPIILDSLTNSTSSSIEVTTTFSPIITDILTDSTSILTDAETSSSSIITESSSKNFTTNFIEEITSTLPIINDIPTNDSSSSSVEATTGSLPTISLVVTNTTSNITDVVTISSETNDSLATTNDNSTKDVSSGTTELKILDTDSSTNGTESSTTENSSETKNDTISLSTTMISEILNSTQSI